MRLPVYLLLLLFTLAFLYGCPQKTDDIGDQIVDVKEEFLIDIWEELIGDVRSFRIDLETIEEESCLNYGINYSVHMSNGNINITINDLEEPADCLPGNAPAREFVELGQWINGFFNVEINLRDAVVNEGRLTVSNDKYLLSMESEEGISLVRTRLFKVPISTIWGEVAYDDAELDNEVNAFMADITELGQHRQYQPGYYGYFSIEQDQSLILRDASDLPFNQTFILKLDGEKDQVVSLLDQYRDSMGDRMQIRLFTWRGEEW